MYNNKLIAVLLALIFIPCAAMAIERHLDSADLGTLFSDNPIFDAKEQSSSILAQNDKSAAPESEKAESEPVTGESEATAEDDKKSSEAESTPPKPFVPSEQIAGEQAVDFPADI